MPRVLGVIALLMSAVACGGGAPPASPSPAAAPTFSLTGTVSETAPTGSVTISGATLTITDGPNANRSTVSGPNGAFRFDGLHPGDFTLRVQAADYRERLLSIVLKGDQAIALEMEPAERRVTTRITGTLGGSAACSGYWDDPPYPTDPCSADHLFDVGSTGLFTAELSYTDVDSVAIVELYGAKNGQAVGAPIFLSLIGTTSTATVSNGHYVLRVRKFALGGGPPPPKDTSYTLTLTYPQ